MRSDTRRPVQKSNSELRAPDNSRTRRENLIYAQAPTGIPYGEIPVQRLQRPAAADLRRSQHVALGPLLHEFGMRHRVMGLDFM